MPLEQWHNENSRGNNTIGCDTGFGKQLLVCCARVLTQKPNNAIKLHQSRSSALPGLSVLSLGTTLPSAQPTFPLEGSLCLVACNFFTILDYQDFTSSPGLTLKLCSTTLIICEILPSGKHPHIRIIWYLPTVHCSLIF